MNWYVYIILNPLEPWDEEVYNKEIKYKPLYVGKGTKNRYSQHFDYVKKQKRLTKKNNTYKNIKLKHIEDAGLEPIYVLIETSSDEDSIILEKELISYFGRKDIGSGILANMTDGGEGISNISKETRQRMSDAHKGQIPANIEQFKYWDRDNLTKEEKVLKGIKAGKSVKNRPKTISEEHKNKISKSLKNVKKSEEHKIALSNAACNREPPSQETKDKISKTKKLQKLKPHNYKEFDEHLMYNVVFLYEEKEMHVSQISKIMNIKEGDIFTILKRCNVKRVYRRLK